MLKEFFEGVLEGQKLFGETIAIIVNSLLLTVVYFIGVGLTAISGKLLKHDFLKVGFDKEKQSYWEDFELGNKWEENCYKQF